MHVFGGVERTPLVKLIRRVERILDKCLPEVGQSSLSLQRFEHPSVSRLPCPTCYRRDLLFELNGKFQSGGDSQTDLRTVIPK